MSLRITSIIRSAGAVCAACMVTTAHAQLLRKLKKGELKGNLYLLGGEPETPK